MKTATAPATTSARPARKAHYWRINQEVYDYEDPTLSIAESANINTRTTLVATAAGSVLAEGLRLREGRFEVEIENLDPDQTPTMVDAVNAEGFVSADRQVEMKNRPGDDDDHRHDRTYRNDD